MDDNLRREAALRADEIDDLANRLAANPTASELERSSWRDGIRDRTQLWRNLLGGALSKEDTVNDQDTSGLEQYRADWDKPSDQVAAERGISMQMVEAVKAAMENGGLKLKFPSDPKYHGGGWHNVGSGGLPHDWEERIRNGQPLS